MYRIPVADPDLTRRIGGDNQPTDPDIDQTSVTRVICNRICSFCRVVRCTLSDTQCFGRKRWIDHFPDPHEQGKLSDDFIGTYSVSEISVTRSGCFHVG